MKYFGVGRIHFSVGKTEATETSIDNYLAEIRKTLEQVPSVANVSIDLRGPSDSERSFNTESPNPQMSDGDRPYPLIHYLQIQFDVYIPFRVQSELSTFPDPGSQTGTEHFAVHIQYKWHGPVAYIECVDAKHKADGSTAVHVVRKFLEKHIGEVESFLIIDSIGPSPFHADFELTMCKEDESDATDSKKIRLNHVRKPGYDRLIFELSEDGFDNEEDAFIYLKDQIGDELAFFYSLSRNRARRIYSWSKISDKFQEILQLEESNSKRKWLTDFIRKRRLLRSTYKDTSVFKGQEIFDSDRIRTDFDDIYRAEKKQTFLKFYNETKIDQWNAYPVKETVELLEFLDQKATKTIEWSIVFIAAIVGGIVGSVVTNAWASTSHSTETEICQEVREIPDDSINSSQD